MGEAALIAEARKWRKMLGGGMRQVGVIAAAGLHALDHHRSRMSEDHANAARLAEIIGAIPGASVQSQATNMVFAELPVADDAAFMESMADRGVLLRSWGGGQTRLVTHLDVAADDIERVGEIVVAALG